jgi:hypothetical protein
MHRNVFFRDSKKVPALMPSLRLALCEMLGAMAIVRRIDFGEFARRSLRPTAPYAIGSLAAFWFFERLAAF